MILWATSFHSSVPAAAIGAIKRRRRNQNFSMSETHVFSSNVFNEARVGWNRSMTFEELETSFTRDVVKEMGLDSQLPLSRDPLEWGPPNFTISAKCFGSRPSWSAHLRRHGTPTAARSGISQTIFRSLPESIH